MSLRDPSDTPRVSFTLPEVAEMTGIPLRALQDGCRAGRVPHTKPKGTRSVLMTEDHIADLLAAGEEKPAPGEGAGPAEIAGVPAAKFAAYQRKVEARIAKKLARDAA